MPEVLAAYSRHAAQQAAMTAEQWGAEACFSSVAGAGAAGQGVDVELKCDGSGAGRGGPQQKDQLPPLMPGLKGRQQQ